MYFQTIKNLLLKERKEEAIKKRMIIKIILMMKTFIRKILCKIKGHNDQPPLIKVWEADNGWQKSVYLCRRCFIYIGEKPYV